MENSLLDRFQHTVLKRSASAEGEECAVSRKSFNRRVYIENDQRSRIGSKMITRLQKSISSKSIPLISSNLDGFDGFASDYRYHCPHESCEPNLNDYRSKPLHTNGLRMFSMAAYHELRRSMSTE